MNSEKLRDAFKYMYPDELPFFKKLIQSLPADPVIVNIGAGAGTSGLAALECRDDSIVHTIDVTDESSPFGCLYAERVEVEKAGLSHLAGDRWFQHHGDSKAIGTKWLTKVDMVFVDGDHSYAGCKGDIEVWLKHLKPGGLLAVHDYRKDELPVNYETSPHPKPWPDIDRAVDELLFGEYKEHSRCDSMIVFANEKLEKEPERQQSKPSASKPRRSVGRKKATKVSDG